MPIKFFSGNRRASPVVYSLSRNPAPVPQIFILKEVLIPAAFQMEINAKYFVKFRLMTLVKVSISANAVIFFSPYRNERKV
jgi:hypothetical protein